MTEKNIFLTGIIDAWASESLRYDIDNSSEKRINIHISSYGGSVNKGFEIANLLQGLNNTSSREIHTYNLAHADSIATVVFLSVPKENRHIVENSTMFKHEPRMIIFDEVTGDKADKMKKELSIQTDRIADYYAKQIEGLDKEEALSLMKKETTLTAKDMLSYGIVIDVMEEYSIAAYRSDIINQKTKNMGLFNKKEDAPVNIINLGEIQAIYQGELKIDAELTPTGEVKDLAGEYEVENKKIVVNEKNVITAIDEVEQGNNDNNDELVNIVSDAISNAVNPLIDEINNLRKELDEVKNEGGNHKPEKSTMINSASAVNIHAEIQNKLQEKQKEIYNKRENL